MVLLLAELRVEVEKLVCRYELAIFLNCRLDYAQPEQSNGLMVAARRQIWNFVDGVVSADSVAELLSRCLEAITHEVEISQFDMSAVMPLIERKRTVFKLRDEIIVTHRK